MQAQTILLYFIRIGNKFTQILILFYHMFVKILTLWLTPKVDHFISVLMYLTQKKKGSAILHKEFLSVTLENDFGLPGILYVTCTCFQRTKFRIIIFQKGIIVLFISYYIILYMYIYNFENFFFIYPFFYFFIFKKNK